MTRQEFVKTVGHLHAVIHGKGQLTTVGFEMTPKRFKGGSTGWSHAEQISIVASDGKQYECSLRVHVVVTGSAKWDGGVYTWSKETADRYVKQYGCLPPNVVVEGASS